MVLASEHEAALAEERGRSNDYHTKAMDCADQRDRYAQERDALAKRVAELEKERDQSALAWSDVETALNFGGAPEADTYANRITAAIQSLTKSRDANLRAVASAEERVAELEAEIYDANKGARD